MKWPQRCTLSSTSRGCKTAMSIVSSFMLYITMSEPFLKFLKNNHVDPSSINQNLKVKQDIHNLFIIIISKHYWHKKCSWGVHSLGTWFWASVTHIVVVISQYLPHLPWKNNWTPLGLKMILNLATINILHFSSKDVHWNSWGPK
jgi:hypothetical protein